ncbi:hypothetical protein GCM10022216_07090 [Sphingobacterium kyonggiense]|uniref:Uncharacterized protein n=1 Tax=Sphingobacterium kyonggiense TaxID=714075 RepID=A0ABP7YF01_9SPHI
MYLLKAQHRASILKNNFNQKASLILHSVTKDYRIKKIVKNNQTKDLPTSKLKGLLFNLENSIITI